LPQAISGRPTPSSHLERNRVRLAFASMWQSQRFCGILRDESLFDRFGEGSL